MLPLTQPATCEREIRRCRHLRGFASPQNRSRRSPIRLAGLCLYVTIVLLFSSPSFATEHKRIMVLHSFGREFRPWNEYANAIRAELDRQSLWILDVQEHSLISARSTDSGADLPFVEYLRSLYMDSPPDLIVVI